MLIPVIDTETSGIEDGQVMEMAVQLVDSDRRAFGSGWHSLVRPPRGTVVDLAARATHHITDEMLEGAPTLPVAMMDSERWLGEWMETEFWAAHNAAFDSQFFLKVVPQPSWICTMRCAMHLWPDAPGYKNQVLRYWLGIEMPKCDLPPHRAMYDAVVTGVILTHLLRERTPQQLYNLTNRPILLRTIRFGEHRGKEFKDVPRSYMQWMLRKGTFDVDTIHTIRHHLGDRT